MRATFDAIKEGKNTMTDLPRHDSHIHTKYLGCANGTMEVPAIVQECERLGVTSLGITDHLNSTNKLALHVPIKKDIEALMTASRAA